MHKNMKPKMSKRSITDNINLNELESSEDEEYIKEWGNLLKTFQCEDECENEDNIPEVPGPSRRRNFNLGPIAATVTDNIFRKRPRVRRKSSDESNGDTPVSDHSKPGSKVTAPQIPAFCSTPLQFFQLFFTDELIKKIVSETNKYAANILATKSISEYSIWKTWTDVNEIEMKAFLGVAINMGLIEVPELRDYWSQAFHSNIPFFGRVFSRKRFMQIFWTLHLETIPELDQGPTQKVENFLNYIKSKCKQYDVPDNHLSIDESTVGFKGGISFLTYNTKKPTKWGKLFFWGLEVSIINSYKLYKDWSVRNEKVAMSHKKYRQTLLMSLIGDFRAPETSRRTEVVADTEQRLDRTPHFIYLHPEGKHKDCAVCSNRKVKGGRRETCYFCKTCEKKPSLHPGICFEKYHTKKNYKE